MAKISDHDTTRESVQLQEFIEEVKNVLNNGNYEIQTTASQEPDYDAPSEPTIVFSLYGATPRLYIAYNGAWYYVTLTAL